MQIFSRLSVSETQVMDLVSPLLTQNPSALGKGLNQAALEPSSALDIFASMAWSTMVEPGDAVAGVINLALGPATSLATLRECIDAQDEGRALLTAISEANPHLENVGKRTLAQRLPEAIERWRYRFSLVDTLSEINVAHRLGVAVLTDQMPDWPPGLNDLQVNKPHVLWTLGRTERLNDACHSVALVGARNASDYGTTVTEELVSGLSSKAFATVSGGAFGIDSVAHRASLADNQTTVAVMAGGLARLYPAANAALFREIQSEGLVISEMPPSREPTKWRFLQRNRLIAAMSKATVVVEAGWRSGSISTANHAAILGRPVAAVPGAITSQTSRGTNQLIRDRKAELIGSAEDLLELISSLHVTSKRPLTELGPNEIRLLDALSLRAKSIERLCVETGMSIREVSSAMTLLQIAGLVRSELSGWRKSNA